MISKPVHQIQRCKLRKILKTYYKIKPVHLSPNTTLPQILLYGTFTWTSISTYKGSLRTCRRVSVSPDISSCHGNSSRTRWLNGCLRKYLASCLWKRFFCPFHSFSDSPVDATSPEPLPAFRESVYIVTMVYNLYVYKSHLKLPKKH